MPKTCESPGFPATAASSAESFKARLAGICELSEESSHLFASPLTPFYLGGRTATLSRFIYFGPRAAHAFAPFELTLCLPEKCPEQLYRRAGASWLLRFLWRYRAFQAYGLHL